MILCTCTSGEAQTGVPEQPEVILWPNPEYPTLQSAVDALRVGGVLQIAEGTHEIDGPVTINKVLRVQGEGACDAIRIDLPGSEPSEPEYTNLVGPPPDSVADADEAVAMFNYVGASAGGVLRRLNISGFDTAILSRNVPESAPDEKGTYGSLVVDQVCIEDTGRGVTWLGSTALSMFNSAILNVLWNAVTLAPRFVRAGSLKAYTFWGMQIYQSGNWCLYQKNGVAAAHLSTFANCAAGGIYVEDGGLSVDDSTFTDLGGPGIAVLRSGAYVENNNILRTEVAGVLLHTSGTSNVLGNSIDQTDAIMLDSATRAYGDGIIAVSSPHVVVDKNTIGHSSRAAISSYGSTVTVLNTTMRCQQFDVFAEDYDGRNGTLNDVAGNTCGCPEQNVSITSCMRSGSAELPPMVGGLE